MLKIGIGIILVLIFIVSIPEEIPEDSGWMARTVRRNEKIDERRRS